MAFRFSSAPPALAVVIGVCAVVPVSAQLVDVTDGYADYFVLSDGRIIDVGQLGGGVGGDPTVHKIDVEPQGMGPGLPVDGRLTGIVHAKFRVVNFTDRNSDGFINGTDLDMAFDVAWQLVGFDKTLGPSSASFVQNVAVGPEGTVSPFGPGSVNFPPVPGGTASIWNIAACSTSGGFDVGGGLENCDPFAIPSPGPHAPYTGFVNYTFPVSIPGVNDFTPGPTIAANTAWVLAALVGQTALAGGPVTYGFPAAYNPVIAASESQLDLFGPNISLNFPGEMANIPVANLLTTVAINVIPEPTTAFGLALGTLLLLGRRPGRE